MYTRQGTSSLTTMQYTAYMIISSAFIFLLVTSVFGQSAVTVDEIENDIQAWSQEALIQEGDIRAESLDEIFYSSPELFPFDEKAMQSSASSASSKNPLVLSIMVGNTRIELQDVPTGAWYAPFIGQIAARSLVSGYRDTAGVPTGYFGPGDPVTVAQMAKVLVQAATINISSCDTTHNQNATNHWSAVFLGCAEQHQWTLYQDMTLDVDRPATRAEVVGTIFEAFDVTPATISSSPFTDVHLSTPYANAILQAQRNEVISGYKDEEGNERGVFGPDNSVNRAEFAKIVVNSVKTYGE